MDPNLHCRTRAHFFWWGTLECLKSTEGKKPKPTETKTSSWVAPRWCGRCRHLLASTTSQRVRELSSNPPEAVMGYPKVQKAGGEPDVGGEERSPFGLPQADRFSDCFICFSLAPACQVLPLLTLICPRGGAPHPAFLHNGASSFCTFIKRRKTISWPRGRIRGWYLSPISGYAVGQII